MSKNLHFYEIVAGADNSRAMEADTIQKNGASPKSHTSRGNFFKSAVHFAAKGQILILAVLGTIMCSNLFAQTQTVPAITVTPEGTILRGASLAAKLSWLSRSVESHNTYIVEVNANENIAPQKLEYSGAINVTVILKGDSVNRTIRLSSHGTMFTVHNNVTLILDSNITLQGHSQNTGAMVEAYYGIFKMNDGSTITGNNYTGVTVKYGTFEMNGGTISGNIDRNYGGGVFVNSGNFTMNGGTISDNKASYGGGVSVSGGSFEMKDGIISGNTASKDGGGVYVSSFVTFEMKSGVISGNKASNGGGVYGGLKMISGTITGNIATEYGGGIYISDFGNRLTKTGGTITGYKSDPDNGNVVNDGVGVIERRGHTVYVTPSRRKETTAGQKVSLDSKNNDNWDE